MRRLRAFCPAKVNLGLSVLGRRSDGFHDIVTIFQAIELCDILEGEVADDLSLEVSDRSIPSDDRNLVLKAARLLGRRADGERARGARLVLHKSIPAESGLGGGSSDAAGALVLLNELWTLQLNVSELTSLAAELGSDVPFFLSGGTALGTGRGDRIEPLPPIEERPVVLASPAFGLSTPAVYRALERPLTGGSGNVTVPRLFLKLAEGNDFALATNDLEVAAFGMSPELPAVRDALLRSGAEVALLSGSGSTVFGLFRAGTEVMSIAAFLRGEFPGWTLRASRTVASGVRIVPAVT